MKEPLTVPCPGQSGTVTVTGVVCSETEPGRAGAVVVRFDIGFTGDELTLDLNNPHVTFTPDTDTQDTPQHWPPQLPGEIWKALDGSGAVVHLITVHHTEVPAWGPRTPRLVFSPLRYTDRWDSPARHATATYVLENYTGIERLREGFEA